MKIYQDRHADSSFLNGKVVAILGYGSQGSAQAKCLRDSGVSVIVGARPGGNSFRIAEDDRMEAMPIGEAARRADIICMLLSDMAQKEIYEKEVAPHLKEGQALYFSHGFNIAFGLITPPKNIDVIMIAPKATGGRLREAYLREEGVPALVSIHQDHTGNAKKTVLALARALRLTKRGVIECTFQQETCANLFAEQAVDLGGALEVVKAGFDTMVARGIPPEVAYFECVGVTRMILDMLERDGLKKITYGISDTACYGSLTRGERVVDEHVRRQMDDVFSEIEGGKFAAEWLEEYSKGGKRFEALKRKASSHQLEKVGEKMRKIFKGESL